MARIPIRVVSLLLALCVGCAVEDPPPASPGSSSADGAALAQDLEELAARVREHALAIQAASDPERLLAGGEPPDVQVLEAELGAEHQCAVYQKLGIVRFIQSSLEQTP